VERDLLKGREKFGESLSLADLNKGYDIMSGKCVTCHRFYKPTEFSVEEWTKIVPWMAPKALLNSEEQSLIYKYVVTKRLTPKSETQRKVKT
jgi:hypothetical protein